jgi:hypothetical protein
MHSEILPGECATLYKVSISTILPAQYPVL